MTKPTTKQEDKTTSSPLSEQAKYCLTVFRACRHMGIGAKLERDDKGNARLMLADVAAGFIVAGPWHKDDKAAVEEGCKAFVEHVAIKIQTNEPKAG